MRTTLLTIMTILIISSNILLIISFNILLIQTYKSNSELIKYINSVHNLIEEQEQFILDYSEDETVIDAIQEGINYEEYSELENKLIKKCDIKIDNNK